MMEYKKKKCLPYLLIGIVLALILNRGYALYSVAPIVKGQLFSQYLYVADKFIDPPYFLFSLKPIGILMILVGLFASLLAYLNPKKIENYRSGEEAGSAKFANIKDFMNFRDKDPKNDMIFSKNGRMGLFNKNLPYQWQLNKNVVAIGLPGDGKTFNFVKPNIMQMNSSYIITDPKGLLVHEVGKMLADNGYNVKVFDLVHLSNSDQFNPFHYMKSELDIDRVTEAIIDGTKKSDNQGENFWVQANLLLTRALIGYLYFDSKVNDYTPNLSMVSDLLRNIKRDNEKIPSPVELLFEDLEEAIPGNYACKQWDLFNQNFQAETRTSVLAVMSAQYSVFDHAQVTQMIERDTMEMETWNIKKTAVFIAIPETNKAFNFLASTMFAVMFEVLTHGADEILQGKVKGISPKDLLHVQMIIDEFANIGKIPNFNEVLASVRSREISIKIIIQAISQLESMYKNDWKTIFNNCATILFLGTNDENTMKYFSMRAGKQTIKQMDHSVNQGRFKSGSVSYRSQSRDLMTPDEIARIGVDEALVFISKQNVLRDKKMTVFDHPMKDQIANSPDDDNWFIYQKYMTDDEEFESNVVFSDDEEFESNVDCSDITESVKSGAKEYDQIVKNLIASEAQFSEELPTKPLENASESPSQTQDDEELPFFFEEPIEVPEIKRGGGI